MLLSWLTGISHLLLQNRSLEPLLSQLSYCNSEQTPVFLLHLLPIDSVCIAMLPSYRVVRELRAPGSAHTLQGVVLTAPLRSNWLGTRKPFEAWGFLTIHVHISQEFGLAFRKAFYLVLINTLPKYSSFVSMWKSRCFLLPWRGMRYRLICVGFTN